LQLVGHYISDILSFINIHGRNAPTALSQQ
jgi:hypothetical protein